MYFLFRHFYLYTYFNSQHCYSWLSYLICSIVYECYFSYTMSVRTSTENRQGGILTSLSIWNGLSPGCGFEELSQKRLLQRFVFRNLTYLGCPWGNNFLKVAIINCCHFKLQIELHVRKLQTTGYLMVHGYGSNKVRRKI